MLQGIAPAAVTLARSGNDMTLMIAESAPGTDDGSSMLLKANLDDYFDQGIEQIQFDNGTMWKQATLRAMLLAPTLPPADTDPMRPRPTFCARTIQVAFPDKLVTSLRTHVSVAEQPY